MPPRGHSPPRQESARDRDGAFVVYTTTMTTKDIIQGTNTGSADVDEDVSSSEFLLYVSVSCPSVLYVYRRILENPAPPSSIPPLCHIRYVPLPVSQGIIFVPCLASRWWPASKSLK